MASASSPPIRQSSASPWLGDIVAGAVTALVFYAEYVSLGATLGGNIAGAGKDTAQAVGSMLVIGSVLVCCISTLCWRLPQPLLAGPRAASLLLLIAGLSWVKTHSTDMLALPATGSLAISLMLVVGALVQLLGQIDCIRNMVKNAEKALTRGFMFVTAAGIVGGMVEKQLAGCLQWSFWTTAGIFTLSVAAASGWTKWCDAGSVKRKRFKAASLFIGMGLAWAGYAIFLPGASSSIGCGTLGASGLDWQVLVARLPNVAQASAGISGLGLWHWVVVALIGAAMGLVQLIETMTALEATESTSHKDTLWTRYISAGATANLLCAPLGLAASSFSAARSNTLAHAHGNSPRAIAVHGVTLAGIALLASSLVSKVPLLAIAVALALVAIQMIDEKTEKDVWQSGYSLAATPAKVHATWLFWLVVGVGFISGQAIAGLLAGAVFVLAEYMYRKTTTPSADSLRS